ncbi:MAG: hypothetical protein ABJA78_13795 [Ferruginibacter sp.]
MKKSMFFLLAFFFTKCAFAQTETFDVTTYTPPKDWKKDLKEAVVNYSTINATAGTFCVLSIYAGTKSTGDAQKDFNKEWNDLVVNAYKAEANPNTETAKSDGWQAITGISVIKIDTINAFTILTVYSGYGKAVSILVTSNDQSYSKNIDDLLATIKINKTKPGADKTNTTQISSGNGKFGSLLYTAPVGWNVSKYTDGDILMPVNIPKDQFLEIWVMPSMNFSGSMEQALQKTYDETVLKLNAAKMHDVYGKDYSTTAAKKSFKGWEYIRCNGAIHIGTGNDIPEFGLDLFLIKINGRFEQVAIVKKRGTCSNLLSYYPSDRLNYHNDIENFLFSLQFADWKDPVISPGNIKGDGITGIWQGIALTVGITAPGIQLGTSYKVKQAVFFSNGQAYFGGSFPAEGLDGMNTLVKTEENRRDWGTYSFSNGKGLIRLPYEDIPLCVENNKMIFTTNNADHGFIKLNSVDGAIFNGTYAFSTKDFPGQETGKTHVISFTSGGRFTDNGAISIMNHPYVPCVDEAKEPGAGTYEVKNYSVIFNYTDGRKIKIAFIGTDYDKNKQSVGVLSFSSNEDPFYKQ